MLGADLRAVVTYDGRMTDAAAALAFPSQRPAQTAPVECDVSKLSGAV
jgi:hypothetical protein